MTRSLASVLAFEIGKMLYKSGIKMRLLLMKQISWAKCMNSSPTYLLKLFFISVSIPAFHLILWFFFFLNGNIVLYESTFSVSFY